MNVNDVYEALKELRDRNRKEGNDSDIHYLLRKMVDQITDPSELSYSNRWEFSGCSEEGWESSGC